MKVHGDWGYTIDHVRICGVCAAKPGRKCRDLATRAPMLVPHPSRNPSPYRQPESGPLFGGSK